MITLRGGDFGSAGVDAAHEFIRQAHCLLAPPQDVPALDSGHSRRASFAVAGLAVLADWIGSNQEWFPYCEPVQDLETYWNDTPANGRCGRSGKQACCRRRLATTSTIAS